MPMLLEVEGVRMCECGKKDREVCRVHLCVCV